MFRIPSKTLINNTFKILFLAAIVIAALSPGSFSGTDGIIAGITGTSIVKAATPGVTTLEASDVTSTGATLNGILEDTGGEDVKVSFEYGTTTGYGSTISGTPSTLNSGGEFNAELTGLNPDTTYHFRAKAMGSGTSYAEDVTFTTPRFTATFTIVTLGISPSTAQTGDTVNISVFCTNTGDNPDIYPVTIKINGVSEYENDVSLDPGESQLVTCGITESKAGKYEVDVNGISSSFIVQESPESANEFDWFLIAGISGGTFVAGLSVLFIFRNPKV